MTIEATENTSPKRRRTSRRNVAPKENPAVDQAMTSIDLSPEAAEDMAKLDDAVSIPPIEPEIEAPRGPAPEPSRDMQRVFEPAEVPPPKLSKEEERAIKEADKQARQDVSPSMKKLGAIGSILPGAERVRISKRRENGQKAYIGEYGLADLRGVGTIEAFVNRYLKPTYGPGEYPIEGITAHGAVIQAQSVYIMEPITDAVPTPGGGTDNALADILRQQLQSDRERQQSDIDRLLQGITSAVKPQAPQQDPIEAMQKLYSFQQEINPPKSEDGTLGAALQAMAQMQQNSMQMMMGMMATVMQKPAMDPTIGLILKALLENKSGGDPMPMMPPPPPPPNPTQSLRELAEVIAILKGGGNGDDKLVSYLMQERMTPKDVLELVGQVKGERGTDDLKKSMENLGIMMNAVNTLRQNTEGGGGGFWDAMASLAQNPALGRLAGGLGRGVSAAERQLPQGSPEDVAMQERMKALQARRLRLEEIRMEQMEQQMLGNAPHREPHKPRVPNQLQHPALQSNPANVATPQPVQPAVAPQQMGQMPKFPEGIVDHVNEMLMAQEDGERIEAFLNMLMFLNEHDEWKSMAQTILHFFHEGDQANATGYVNVFLDSLVKINFIDAEAGNLTAAALHSHFGEVVAHVRQVAAGSNEEDGSEEEDDAGFTELAESSNILGMDEDDDEDAEEDEGEEE